MSNERFDTWMQSATKFFVLSNAGGAVAVLSFLGAKSGTTPFPCLAIVALLCFVVGLIVSGVAIMAQLTGAYREFLSSGLDAIAADHSIKKNWTTRLYDSFEPHTGKLLTLAFGLFTVGSLVGVLGLAIGSFAS